MTSRSGGAALWLRVRWKRRKMDLVSFGPVLLVVLLLLMSTPGMTEETTVTSNSSISTPATTTVTTTTLPITTTTTETTTTAGTTITTTKVAASVTNSTQHVTSTEPTEIAEETQRAARLIVPGKSDQDDDPALRSVFPEFAAQLANDSAVEKASLAPADFVDTADFAVLNSRGDLEATGSGGDELVSAVERLRPAGGEEVDQVQQLMSLVDSGNGGQQQQPTTLMLFNIFTPDEVDFLSQLVGEDVVKELKEEEDDDDDEDTKPKMRDSLQPYDNGQTKNDQPSSRDQERPDSSTRGSLEPYHKPIFSTSESTLEEEGQDSASSTESATRLPLPIGSVVQPPPPPSGDTKTYQGLLTPMSTELQTTVDDRRNKMESLLTRLSDKYKKRTEEVKQQPQPPGGSSSVETHKEEEETQRMKVMIDNLKAKLANSRPGMNRLSLDGLDEETRSTTAKPYYTASTQSVPLQVVESMLGEKLRDTNTVGIHRVNLDEMLDTDVIHIKKEETSTAESTSSNSRDDDKSLPKRQVHPKLIYQRPESEIVHRPSMNLKDHISLASEEVDPAAVKYKSMPIIPRYSDAVTSAAQPGGSSYHPNSYMNYGSSSTISSLRYPEDKPPGLRQKEEYHPSSQDPHPETKELPPYHHPTPHYSLLRATTPKPKYLDTTTSLPPAPYYPDRPGSSIGPSPYADHQQQSVTPKVLHGVTIKSDLPPAPYYPDKPGSTIGYSPYVTQSTPSYVSPEKPTEKTKYVQSSSYREPPLPRKEKSGRHYEYPPPSSQYKPPSLHFNKMPAYNESIEVTPKNVPSSEYSVPLSKYESSNVHLEDVKSLGPGYAAPNSYQPPVLNVEKSQFFHAAKTQYYLTQDLTHYSPPESPSPYEKEEKTPSSYLPPSKDYAAPTEIPKAEYTMSPPSKDYLPPKVTPDAYSPHQPSKEYLPPLENNYESPVKVSAEYEHMEPPHQEYGPPVASYMTTMKPPTQDYVSPKEEYPSKGVPSREYLPPQLAVSTLSPYSSTAYPNQYVSTTIAPPVSSYLPPKSPVATSMAPPTQGYSPPIIGISGISPASSKFEPLFRTEYPSTFAPPSKQYLPPKSDYHASTTAAPSLEYLPPKSTPSYSNASPPSKEYLPPIADKPKDADYKTPVTTPGYSTTMTPPHADYIPPVGSSTFRPIPEHPTHSDMKHMAPPTAEYSAPAASQHHGQDKELGLSKAHFQECPHIEEKSFHTCKNFTQHTCWSAGVRDLDCPLSGLCCFDGCVNTCLPPNYIHDPQHHADGKTPKQLDHSAHEASKAIHPGHDKSLACPAREKEEHCGKHASHQCWSPGVPDLDCPGSGLCCFNGCVNVCIMGHHEVHNSNQYHLHHHHHHHHHHPVSYHTPPNSKYLVPSSIYIPHDIIHGGNHNPAPSPPMLGMENIYALGELDHMNQGVHEDEKPYTAGHTRAPVGLSSDYSLPSRDYLPPPTRYEKPEDLTHYNVPGKEYLPPRANHGRLITAYAAPEKEYLPPHVDSKLSNSYVPPSSKYLPPQMYVSQSYEAPTSEYLPVAAGIQKDKGSINNVGVEIPDVKYTKPEESPNYQPPGKEYLPPADKKESSNDTHYAAPTKEYLPPPPDSSKKTAGESYLPPSKEYLPPADSKEKYEESQESKNSPGYAPPSKEYLPPTKYEDVKGAEDQKAISSPSKEYLPPSAEKGASPTQPSKEYLPPKDDQKIKADDGEKYLPPSKEYLPPTIYEKDKAAKTEKYSPPSKEYLPPADYSRDKETNNEKYLPPSKEYLPPTDYSKERTGEKYAPPSKDYLPPSSDYQNDKLAESKYSPPTKEYLPPPNTYQKDKTDENEKYSPPSKEYLPPTDYKKDETAEYSPPSKEYLPPTDYSKGKDEKYSEPSKEYLPPTDYHKSTEGDKYSPPSKEYLPPTDYKKDKTEESEKYSPPSKEYLPPTSYKKDPFAAESEKYSAPSKEYLPPTKNEKEKVADSEKYSPPSKEYLPPTDYPKDKAPYNDKYSPPSKEYLPPTDYQKDKVADSERYSPPSKEYLPPTDYKKDKASEGEKYLPPSKEYLQPTEYKKDHTEKYSPPSKEYLPPVGYEKKTESDKYSPPSKDYLPPSSDYQKDKLGESKYSPPSKEYLPPPTEYQKEKEGDKYLPPSKEYLPPPNEYHKEKKDENAKYLPPSKEYLPPTDYQKAPEGEKYAPPSKEYLPPGKYPDKATESGGYLPPSKEYLPPPNRDVKEGYSPPSKDYLPPKEEKGSSYLPPSKEYLPPPNRDKVVAGGETYAPPAKEYLPPPKYKDDKTHYGPPTKEYLPPAKSYSPDHYEPPTDNYHPEQGQSYSTPSKEYLPPSNEGKDYKTDAHYSPPTHEYLPPPAGYKSEIKTEGVGYAPPGKEYLPPPPNSYDSKEKLSPPSKDYLPPPPSGYRKGAKEYVPTFMDSNYDHVKDNHKEELPPPPYYDDPKLLLDNYKPPSKDYLSPPSLGPQSYSPPSKDYLPSLPGYEDKHYLPPSKEYLPPPYEKKSGGVYEPPSKDYLPPSRDYHDKKKGESYLPPSKEYLPPTDGYHDKKKGESYLPPSKEYLPPPGNDYPLLPKVTDFKPPSKEYLPPLGPKPSGESYAPPSKDYLPPVKDISKEYLPPTADLPSVFINGLPQLPAKSGDQKVYPHSLPPHSISIQINIPEKHKDGQQLPPPPPGYLPPALPAYVPPPKLAEEKKKPGYAAAQHVDDRMMEEDTDVPSKAYLPPKAAIDPPKGYFAPPSLSYLPPPAADKTKVGYLPPPLPPLPKDKYTDYLPPPPRPDIPPPPPVSSTPPDPPPPEALPAALPQILNSQAMPPSLLEEKYIPPKTQHDVPKNFLRPEDVKEEVPEPPPPEVLKDPDAESITAPTAFLGLAKLKSDNSSVNGTTNASTNSTSEKQTLPKLPPMPTETPPQPDSFLPLLEQLNPDLLESLRKGAASAGLQGGGGGGGGGNSKIPGIPGKDYPDFKAIPATEFSCENFLLEGFYADTFTSCQVFHVCESGKRQSSFICPKGTIFNQKHRVCDWWYNVKCEDSTEFYDLNLDLLLLENQKASGGLKVPPPIDPFDNNLLLEKSFGSEAVSLLGEAVTSKQKQLDLLGMMNSVDRSDDGESGGYESKGPSTFNALDSSSAELRPTAGLSNEIEDQEEEITPAGPLQLHSDLKALRQLSKDLDKLELGDLDLSRILSAAATTAASPSRPPPPSHSNEKGKSSNRRSGGSGEGLTLCQLMNICDSQPAATDLTPEATQEMEEEDDEQMQPFPSVQPKVPQVLQQSGSGGAVTNDQRTGEKTAAEIADMFAKDAAASKIDTMKKIEEKDVSSSVAEGEALEAKIQEAIDELRKKKGEGIVPKAASPSAEDQKTAGSSLVESRHPKMVEGNRTKPEDTKAHSTVPTVTNSDSVKSDRMGSAFELGEDNIDRDSSGWMPNFFGGSSSGGAETVKQDRMLNTDESWIPLG